MKEKIIIISLLLMLPLAAMQSEAARKKAVKWESVASMYSKTSAMSVTGVEFTDTATVLHATVKFRPGEWIRIARESYLTDMQGRRYGLTSAEGIVPGEKLTMPPSGRVGFTLRFAPMPRDTRTFDFMEGENRGDWQIFGIYDKRNMPDTGAPKELKEKQYTADEMLPAVRYAPGKVKVRCKVYGYRPAMKAKVSGWYETIDYGKQKHISAPVADDGTAEFEVELSSLSSFVAGIESLAFARIIAAPGEEISLAFDMAGRSVFGFTGRFARTSKEMTEGERFMDYVNTPDSVMTAGIKGCTTAGECSAFLNRMLAERKAAIDAFPGISSATRSLLRMMAENENLQWRYSLSLSFVQANVRLANVRTPEEYEALMKTLPMPYFDGPLTEGMPAMECLDSDHALVFPDALTSAYSYKQPVAIANGHNREVALTHAFLTGGKTSPDETAEATVTDPGLRALIAEKRARDKQLQEELARRSGVYFHQLDSVKPEEILPAILGRYAGKAVLVDIWATWCGPCKAGHKQMVPLKEELKGEDVAFVYVTGPTSPAETWQEMIGDISGEHYYLTAEQYRYILDKHESKGIPTYLLFGRDGQLAFKHIGTVGNDEMKAEIMKALGR